VETFYTKRGEYFVATPLTRGPWSIEHQHGGPPSALLARAASAAVSGSTLARLSVELVRPVTMDPLTVAIEPLEMGRKVQRLSLKLRTEKEFVGRAQAILIRNAPQEVPPAPGPSVAPPESVERLWFPFFSWEGYQNAVDARVVEGAWGSTPITVWARTIVGLVDGEPITPLENLFVLADAESGIGPPLDVRKFTFVNPDLDVHIARAPEGEWLGMQVRSWAGGAGAGIAASILFDARGLVGRASQSLVIESR
jgi:hypothetical protein